MKLRWFRVPFHDGVLYDLNAVELTDDGKISTWSPTPIVTLENIGDAPVFLDAVRDANRAIESEGVVEMELEMRMWGE